MRIIGIDTATSPASVALVENGRVVAEELSEPWEPRTRDAIPSLKSNHAEIILPLIESLLRESRRNLVDISAFAISIGPGSFTGLRIGLSTIKGLAYGCSIPVLGISTLLANAARVTDHEGLICSFLNARKSEVYASLFRKDGNLLHRIDEESAAPAKTVIERVASLDEAGPCLFLGDGVMAYDDLIHGYLGTGAILSAGECYPSVASAVARLGQGQFKPHDNDNGLGAMVPTYLRAPDYVRMARSGAQLVEIPSDTLR